MTPLTLQNKVSMLLISARLTSSALPPWLRLPYSEPIWNQAISPACSTSPRFQNLSPNFIVDVLSVIGRVHAPPKGSCPYQRLLFIALAWRDSSIRSHKPVDLGLVLMKIFICRKEEGWPPANLDANLRIWDDTKGERPIREIRLGSQAAIRLGSSPARRMQYYNWRLAICPPHMPFSE